MKTMVDLPDSLIEVLRHRAAREGRDVQDVVAAILTEGMARESKSESQSRLVAKTLPVIKARAAPPSGTQLSTSPKMSTQEWCDWIKEMDLRLDVERHEKALGHQHVDRADP